MSTDIQYWDDALTEEISSIQQLLDAVPSSSDPDERAAVLEEVEDRLRSAKGIKRSFKMETRLISDVQQRRRLEGRLKKMDQELRTLKADWKALQADEYRDELFVGSGGGAQGMNPEDAVLHGDKKLNEASQIQDKTQVALDNVKNMVAESKEVGVSTLEELQRQRETIQRINDDGNRMNDNLARAEQLLKQFGKRMASDKFIQCFALLNCLLLVGVVFYAIRKKDGDDAFIPPPARGLRG